MTVRSAFVLTAIFALTLPIGCESRSPVEVPSTGSTETPSSRGDSKAPAQGLQLVTASWDDTQALIARHQGKVVVVDFWSTWCEPCVKEFPNLVKIHEQFDGKVVCISVNCNYSGAADESAEDAREEVHKFLKAKKANFTHVLCKDADTYVLTKLKAASVPIVRVYDKQGQLHKQFINDDREYGDEGFEYAKHIVPLVETLAAD